jgi:thioredoxin reductase
VAPRGFDPKAVAGKFPEPDRQIQVLVVGAGPAGVAAAIGAAEGGAGVLLVDENPLGPGLMGLDTPLYYGGRYTGAVQSRARMTEQVFSANPLLETAFEAGVEIELGGCCWGAWVGGEGLVSLPGPVAGLADDERAWMVGFETLILATGARDVAFSFQGWDQPGVMGAQGLHALVKTYDAFTGRRLAILGSGSLALQTALFALDHGLEVAALVEVESEAQGPAELVSQVRSAGVEILTGFTLSNARGGLDGVESLTVQDRDGFRREIECDTIVQAISLTPVVELLGVLGVELAMQPTLGGHAPVSPDGTSTSLPNVFLAGEAAGAPGGGPIDFEAARESGRRAALAALRRSHPSPEFPQEPLKVPQRDAVVYQQSWMRRLMAVNVPEVLICQCEEVSREALLAVRQPAYLGPPSEGMTLRDFARLLEDGPANQDQIKRLTRACMGPCQARRCREQVALALACAANESAANIPLAGYRAPVRPLPLSVLADWEEARSMSRHWDVWLGIPTQWVPYADIGTDREFHHAGVMGGEPDE